ncbi:MAG TPA: aminotransferase class V-fold PLP-dependent enzyme [Thermoanaerobaculia bacterium]|nr:aminotransferase class V-fold PLP-dependent enzyme [Thermoanaerobaculia bacterium]
MGEAATKARRQAPIEIEAEEFRRIGHRLVDQVADWLDRMPNGPVTPGESPAEIRAVLGQGDVPEVGAPAGELVEEAARMMFDHSLFNGHPRFFGFITSSAAPIGALGDLLASSVNPNVGGFPLSPLATEIEAQTVRWIAQLLGYPDDCGGLLVSGGNVANFVGFWAARRALADWDLRRRGNSGGPPARFYASKETHTWVQKAADLSGFGTDAIRWIETDSRQRMRFDALQAAIEEDRAAGALPMLVVGTAGSVSTGAVDPLREIAALCREEGLWLHVDGAYGAPAAMLPEADPDLKALALADSVAVDPHKWLYAPLEAGCALVRDRKLLRGAFVYHPPYYPDTEAEADAPIFFHEYGPQNSRGFRALKVWLALRQVGRRGYIAMLRDDIALARRLAERCAEHPELEAATCDLSIATFRFVPRDLASRAGEGAVAAYLDRLNEELMGRLMAGGEAFVSNAVVGGRYLLRACIVNFRTSEKDVDAVPGIVVRAGRELDAELRPAALAG